MENSCFFDQKDAILSDFHYLESRFYSSNTDIVETLFTVIQDRHNHSESYITVIVSQTAQKVEIYLAKGRSGPAFFSSDLGHFFGTNVAIDLGVMLKGKVHYKPQFVYDVVRIHFLMIHMELIDYNIVADTKAALLRCFFFIPELKLETL